MQNIHERIVEAPADVIGTLLDGMGRAGDRLWPTPAWEPMILDRSVQVGAAGGHGPIRYRVVEHEPKRRVRFAFDPECGLEGTHEMTVTPLGPERCQVRHVVDAEPRGAMRVFLPLVVVSMHDAVLEDLLDNAERAGTGSVRRPAQWSSWVKALYLLTEGARPRSVPIPAAARLARAAFADTDLADAWQVSLRPGHSRDPEIWADAVFRQPPELVSALLGLRNLLVPLIGVERGNMDSFNTVDRTDDEVLLGADADHLDFRASILIAGDTLTVSSVARAHNSRGRIYLAPVRLAHPGIVRAMLRHAVRRQSRWQQPNQGSDLGKVRQTDRV